MQEEKRELKTLEEQGTAVEMNKPELDQTILAKKKQIEDEDKKHAALQAKLQREIEKHTLARLEANNAKVQFEQSVAAEQQKADSLAERHDELQAMLDVSPSLFAQETCLIRAK